jgi:hypothetical protein
MNTITIQTEMNKRTELIESVEFRKTCANVAKQIGITPEQWESNKAMLMMYFANEYIKTTN